jgi:hypothetical protein
MESSNLNKDIPPIFIIISRKRNHRSTLLQTTGSLVVPIEYHGSYNEGVKKKQAQHRTQQPN